MGKGNMQPKSTRSVLQTSFVFHDPDVFEEPMAVIL